MELLEAVQHSIFKECAGDHVTTTAIQIPSSVSEDLINHGLKIPRKHLHGTYAAIVLVLVP